ncbi:hypothetical protein AB9F39_36940, partial [Rhizobium leguminosarum]
ACDHPEVRLLVIDSLRHFVLNAGVDGFRFDLAPVLGRTATVFERNGTLAAILSDDVLADRIMIANPVVPFKEGRWEIAELVTARA